MPSRFICRCTPWLVLGLIAAMAAWGWRSSVPAQPILVVGPSMAPTYMGEHDAWVCVDCGFPFATGVEEEEAGAAICPYCDRRQPDRAAPQRQPGDRLLVDRPFSGARMPQRWEPVVFRCPDQQRAGPSAHCIKRVVGLPGETVQLRGGDVWIDGRRAPKPLPQQLALAIPVYDSHYQPHEAPQIRSGWLPDRADEANLWQTSGLAFRFAPPGNGAPAGHADWLRFHYQRRKPSDDANFQRSAVLDDYAYNRGESRQLNRVDDLLVIARLTTRGVGVLMFRGEIDGTLYTTELATRAGNDAMRMPGNQAVPNLLRAAAPLSGGEHEIIFSLFDHQVILAVDGQVLVSHPIAEPAAGLAPSAEPQRLEIGAEGLTVNISRLQVLRDIYYTAPRQLDAQLGIDAPCKLGGDEYFVLGDNSPLSADSRQGWPGPGLAGHQIIGTVRTR